LFYLQAVQGGLPMTEPNAASEPDPKLKDKLPTLWDKNKNASIVGGLVGVLALVGSVFMWFVNASANSKVEKTELHHERELGRLESEIRRKDDELRHCTNANASLQAVLQLGEKDRNRLIEMTATVPSVRVSYMGKPFVGTVFVTEKLKPNECADLKVMFENTGPTDINGTGAEIVTESFAGMQLDNYFDSMVEDGKVRHFVESVFPISPGGRRFSLAHICDAAPRDGGIRSTKGRFSFFSEGHLPLSYDIELIFNAAP
jgi:hypothetical protein